MNNMIPQLVCDIESSICNCTFSMLAPQSNIYNSSGVSCFTALLKMGLENDDFILLLPPLLASSPKK